MPAGKRQGGRAAVGACAGRRTDPGPRGVAAPGGERPRAGEERPPPQPDRNLLPNCPDCNRLPGKSRLLVRVFAHRATVRERPGRSRSRPALRHGFGKPFPKCALKHRQECKKMTCQIRIVFLPPEIGGRAGTRKMLPGNRAERQEKDFGVRRPRAGKNFAAVWPGRGPAPRPHLCIQVFLELFCL